MTFIGGVLFDLDQTLLDRHQSLLSFLDWQWNEQKALQIISKNDFQSKFIELDDNGKVWKDKVYKQILHDCKTESIEASYLLQDYLANFPRHAILFPEVINALTILKNNNIKLGIVTNGRENLQSAVIRSSGLEPYMDVVLISEAEGIEKPDPKIFHSALIRLDLEPSRCVFVGDNPNADINGAHNVGMKTILKKNESLREPIEASASAAFDDFKDLPKIIRSIYTTFCSE